jgi:hypothetical protein
MSRARGETTRTFRCPQQYTNAFERVWRLGGTPFRCALDDPRDPSSMSLSEPRADLLRTRESQLTDGSQVSLAQSGSRDAVQQPDEAVGAKVAGPIGRRAPQLIRVFDRLPS